MTKKCECKSSSSNAGSEADSSSTLLEPAESDNVRYLIYARFFIFLIQHCIDNWLVVISVVSHLWHVWNFYSLSHSKYLISVEDNTVAHGCIHCWSFVVVCLKFNHYLSPILTTYKNLYKLNSVII